ncbi:NTF2 fold immunity protein [Xanthomonas codiaei]|uniref:NTF2 fold immunity protein n=1 Tax=Xanthomonas codiaei TaxID=56463 RepID=A0A2S7CF16_9XANT|nr:NTF2 fold immunity protein [Xanthomonas codiaei]PPU60157.1 hypothetical protein XcodCFBP4690_18340 [Xanthomonas codiaei]
MTILLVLALLSAASTPVCSSVAPGAEPILPTESTVVAAAKAAWRNKFSSAAVNEREQYQAELKDGVWHVFGKLPAGWRGGTPEALICASDGKVLKVFHSR